MKDRKNDKLFAAISEKLEPNFATPVDDGLITPQEVEVPPHLMPLPKDEFKKYLCGDEVVNIYRAVGCRDLESYFDYLMATYKLHGVVLTLLSDQYLKAGNLHMLEDAIKEKLEIYQGMSEKLTLKDANL